MSTPSETIRTATIQRSSPAANASIRALAPGSSDSTTVGGSPVIASQLRGVGAGRLLVGGDDEAAGVRARPGAPR